VRLARGRRWTGIRPGRDDVLEGRYHRAAILRRRLIVSSLGAFQLVKQGPGVEELLGDACGQGPIAGTEAKQLGYLISLVALNSAQREVRQRLATATPISALAECSDSCAIRTSGRCSISFTGRLTG
jgi:hypothetical protein